MADQDSWWDSVRVKGEELLGRVQDLVREGNVRRVIINRMDGRLRSSH